MDIKPKITPDLNSDSLPKEHHLQVSWELFKPTLGIEGSRDEDKDPFMFTSVILSSQTGGNEHTPVSHPRETN